MTCRYFLRLYILSQTTLDLEKERIQNECSVADIDFEFVIDSSSSIGTRNWQLTMDDIAQYWIKGKDNMFPDPHLYESQFSFYI